MAENNQIATKRTFWDYIILWSGQNISYLGSAIVIFIIILQLAGGANAVLSIAAIIGFGPNILFGPLAGVLADRFDKKTIILISDSIQALATFALIMLYYTVEVQIWMIYVILGVRGICQAFHGPVVMSLTPLMVPKEKLSRMNGIAHLFQSIINILGPVLGASILLVLKVQEALWIDVITYFIAVVPLFLIKIPKVPTVTESDREGIMKSMRGGFSLFRMISGLFSLMIVAMFINLLLQPIDILFPNYVLVEFGKDEQILAYALATFQVGFFLGAIITIIKKNWKNKSKWILFGLLVTYFFYGLMVLPKLLSSEFFYLLFLFMFFMGIFIPIINVLVITIVQLVVPMEKMGRVSSIMMIFSTFALPIGMVGSGFAADALSPISGKMGGIGFLYLICGLVGLILCLTTWFFTDWRKLGSDQIKETLEENPMN